MNKKEIIEKIKKEYLDEESIEKLENIKDQYGEKSDEDIFVEIIQLNADMKKNMDEEKYRAILEKLDSIRPLLSKDQSDKLDTVLGVLGKEDKN